MRFTMAMRLLDLRLASLNLWLGVNRSAVGLGRLLIVLWVVMRLRFGLNGAAWCGRWGLVGAWRLVFGTVYLLCLSRDVC